MKRRSRTGGLAVQFSLALLHIYRLCISGWTRGCCRFTPTCSQYARLALLRFGFLRGTQLTVWRLLRCHPLYRGCLHDPVPDAPESDGIASTKPLPQPYRR